ncbi:hypothetical protein RJ639_039983 [Escallonia herrerae]|uniref:CCHC-type domain-containing protein n=1 Tax=Escallonia herrerae TaxID=1293975 RepID=A0AA88WJG8_9ASTE|nr:hypothetical protein RJ639_039983 [Escallonia herrerae]
MAEEEVDRITSRINRGRSPTREKSKSKGKSKSKWRTIACWNCNKEGHKKNDCTEPKKKKRTGGRQGDDDGPNMNALSGMKNIQLDFCKGCVYGKQKRASFQRDDKEKKTKKLELIRIVKRRAQEDGLAERMNRTIMERARLQEQGIEKENREYMKLDAVEDGQVSRIENSQVLDETTDIDIGAEDQQQADGMLVAGSSMGKINELKKKLASTFSMKDLDKAKVMIVAERVCCEGFKEI